MRFATPAELSPVPEAEAPRDCPLCPRLVAFRAECRAEFPDWWNAPVPAFGDRLVGKLVVQGVPIGGGVDGDATNTELAAGPDHAQGDLTPVRNEYLAYHYSWGRR